MKLSLFWKIASIYHNVRLTDLLVCKLHKEGDSYTYEKFVIILHDLLTGLEHLIFWFDSKLFMLLSVDLKSNHLHQW